VGGIRESDLVLTLAAQIRAALEKQGFSVVQTRQSNNNPSLDDRSAMANAQRGAIFVSLHIGSTGLPGTVRVYTLPDASAAPLAPGALLPWDRAQATILPMSRKLAEMAQAEVTLRFKGSPNVAPSAPVRQLRTIALPAIAIELSSVSVEERQTLDKMLPGVAEAVARAVAAYKTVYDVTPAPGALP
jgi:N-acetylmuramoyl-L-alanine amidase